jgi:hypothetical protein
MNTVKDIDGEELMIGDKVSTDYGECRILALKGDEGNRFGALVSVQNSKGDKLDLRVRLSHVKLILTTNPKEKITDQKYGV